LLNIGPKADGSVPEPSVRILRTVGKWIERNGPAIQGIQKAEITYGDGVSFSRKGNAIYFYVGSWPGSSITIGGIREKPKSAKFLVSGREVKAHIDGTRLVFSELPHKAPDEPVTVIVAEFETAPVQDSEAVRIVEPFKKLIHDQSAKGWH